MPLIRCTKKLLTEIGAPVSSSADQVHAALLSDWYANLIWIERRKSVVFTSERTLLSFLVVGAGRDAIRDYATLFRSGLRRLLENEHFIAGDIDRVVGEYQELKLAPTNDRSVLGLAQRSGPDRGGTDRVPSAVSVVAISRQSTMS